MGNIWVAAVVGLAGALGAGCTNEGAYNDAKHRAGIAWKVVASSAKVQSILTEDEGQAGPAGGCHNAALLASVAAEKSPALARSTAETAATACPGAGDAATASKQAWEVCGANKR